jgi:hypothetical protein
MSLQYQNKRYLWKMIFHGESLFCRKYSQLSKSGTLAFEYNYKIVIKDSVRFMPREKHHRLF